MSLLGLLLCLLVMMLAQWWHGGALATLIDGPAALMVLGGTIGAVLVQTPLAQWRLAMKQLTWLVRAPRWDFWRQAQRLLGWAQFARQQGLLALEQEAEQEHDPLTKQGLDMIVDGLTTEDIRQQLDAKIDLTQQDNEHAAQVFEAMGGYSPTIGIIGAVLGLIQAMSHLDDPKTLGVGIAVAFVATIYGVGLANLFCLPIANRLRAYHARQLLFQEMTLEGLLAIAQGENLLQLERRLMTYYMGRDE